MLIHGAKTNVPADVTPINQFIVLSEEEEHQHWVSKRTGLAFQALAVTTGITASSTTNLFHITNNSPTRDLVVTFIRVQPVLAGTLPTSGCYFSIGFDETFSSGGTEITPVGVNTGKPKSAGVTVYGGNPTLSGTLTEIDRIYVKENGDEQSFEKKGSVIIGQNKTMTVKLITDTGNTGVAKVRLSFLMIDRED